MNYFRNKINRRHFFFILIAITFIAFITFGTGSCCKPAKSDKKEIKLVLMIVIDQLRADFVSQLENRFGNDGFRYLMENGTWFKNARYDYATTITSVGHATLFTGTTPSNHGIIGNYWFDTKTEKRVNPTSIPDPNNPESELQGPYRLLSTTIGDELILAYNRQSRMFGVSLKDRAAIFPSGFMGKAFWFNTKTGNFRTSSYYYKTDPQWLNDWNNKHLADSYKNKQWELLNKDRSTYIYDKYWKEDEETIQKNNPNIVKRSAFPHSFPKKEGEDFYSELANTPFGDEILVDFACQVLKKEKLGQEKYPDMLSVSFSVTDIIGHNYGPDSLEYEDNVLRVDQSLAKLFRAVDDSVGLKKTLIIVTADHGGDHVPDMRALFHIPGERIESKDFKTIINSALQTRYKTTEDFVGGNNKNTEYGFWTPSIYLKLSTIEKLKLDIEEVEKIAATALLNNAKGIAAAITRSDLLKGNVPNTPIMKSITNVFHFKRSGNILIIQEPYWYLYHNNTDPAMHGSPYSYDNHVPLFFAGPGIKSRSVYRQVLPWDIAGTVALKLGIEAPPVASKNALTEIFD